MGNYWKCLTPFRSSKDRARSVSSIFVTLTIGIQVVPKGSASFPGPECHTQRGENRRTTGFNVTHLVDWKILKIQAIYCKPQDFEKNLVCHKSIWLTSKLEVFAKTIIEKLT